MYTNALMVMCPACGHPACLYAPPADRVAAAVNGMNPKINIWTQGEAASSGDAMAPLRNLFTSLPPMLVRSRSFKQPLQAIYC